MWWTKREGNEKVIREQREREKVRKRDQADGERDNK